MLHPVNAGAAAAFIEVVTACDHRVVAGLVAEKLVERGHVLIKVCATERSDLEIDMKQRHKAKLSSGGRIYLIPLWKFIGTVFSSYCRPLAKHARLGAHTGAPTNACVNRTPAAATESKCGVKIGRSARVG